MSVLEESLDLSVWGEVGTCWMKNEKRACQFPVDCKKILKNSFGRLCSSYWIKFNAQSIEGCKRFKS